MVKYRGVCAAVLGGLIAFVGLMGTAQAQGVDPYEQYYGPRPTPYSSTYSQPYQQPTYQPPQNPQPTYQAPQQYGQQPYYGGYQQPQYGGQPAQPADPYQQTRVEGQGGTGVTVQPVEVEERVRWAVYAGVGPSAVYLPEYSDIDTEVGANIFTGTQLRMSGGFVNFRFGMELGYHYLGEFDVWYGTFNTNSGSVSIMPGIGIGDHFDVYARVGGHYWSFEQETYWGATYSRTGFNLIYGAGLQANVDETFGVRLDWVDHNITGGDILRTFSAAIVVSFL